MAEEANLNLLATMLTVMVDDLPKLTDAQRLRIVNLFASKFCLHCGSLSLPCHCTRDE